MAEVATEHPSTESALALAETSSGHESLRTLDTLAALDIGTNSFHMVIARIGDGHTFEVIDRAKDMVRLGSSGGDMKRLEPDAIDRGVAALARFRHLADSNGAPIRAV